MKLATPIFVVTLTLSFIQPLTAIELPGTSALADLILGEFDNNSDGTLDTGEWQEGVENGFTVIDQNGDNQIDPAEIELLSSPIGEKAGDFAATLVTPLITRIVMSFDANSDNIVDQTEYSDRTEALRKKADTDEDAQLSEKELRAIPQKLLTGLQ